jgi:hypothetical protein
MTEKTDRVKAVIDSLSSDELQDLVSYLRQKLPRHPLEEKWGISHELILDAIHRSQDIVQRGVRGVIAEAVFDAKILTNIKGWHSVPVLGDLPYDFKIRRDSDRREITVQVKLQRTEAGLPLTRKRFGPDTFIVEVQKTRTGTKKPKKTDVLLPDTAPAAPEKTRPYQFGDFDILAVNMQPSAHDWTRFMYTVGSWLMPRAGDKKLMEIMQPVAEKRSEVWTDSIEECFQWFLSGEKKLIFDMEAAKEKTLVERDANESARKG